MINACTAFKACFYSYFSFVILRTDVYGLGNKMLVVCNAYVLLFFRCSDHFLKVAFWLVCTMSCTMSCNK